MRESLQPLLLVVILLQSFTFTFGDSGRNIRNSIPRSTSSLHSRQSDEDGEIPPFVADRPPWNPSPRIDSCTGFLSENYDRIPGEWEAEAKLGGKHQNHKKLKTIPVQIRQVPGDGNCLFHSISTCWAYAVNGTHFDYMEDPLDWLYRSSAKFRQEAVECLRRRRLLFLQGKEYLRASDLVEAAASQYGITAEEYCDLMQQDSYWGGGPEIVALCNVLKRPIHVYELTSSTTVAENGENNDYYSSTSRPRFLLRRMACFGSPKFDNKQPLHILSADSRFPDITPGKQLAAGNHFLAVFPVEESYAGKNKSRRNGKQLKSKVRGGGSKDRAPPQPFQMDGRNVAKRNGDEADVGRSGSQQSIHILDSLNRTLLGWLKRLLGASFC